MMQNSLFARAKVGYPLEDATWHSLGAITKGLHRPALFNPVAAIRNAIISHRVLIALTPTSLALISPAVIKGKKAGGGLQVLQGHSRQKVATLVPYGELEQAAAWAVMGLRGGGGWIGLHHVGGLDVTVSSLDTRFPDLLRAAMGAARQ